MDLMGVSDGLKMNGAERIATKEPEISNGCRRSSVTAPASTELSIVSNPVQQNALEMSSRKDGGETWLPWSGRKALLHHPCFDTLGQALTHDQDSPFIMELVYGMKGTQHYHLLRPLRKGKTWATAVPPPITEAGKAEGPKGNNNTDFYENQKPGRVNCLREWRLSLDLVTCHTDSKELVKGPCWVLVPDILWPWHNSCF